MAILILYKYTNFLLSSLNLATRNLMGKEVIVKWDFVLPIGLSFMIFQACTYLSDVYRDNIKAERDIIRYATFIAFFPTVLSGPIQKARNLIPQIRNPQAFEFDSAKKGTLLFVWGIFEKIMVANRLAYIYLKILPEYVSHTSAEILVGAICFSIYIYADFSSYSDMARGISLILGIDVGKNFSNPYLSRTTSEF